MASSAEVPVAETVIGTTSVSTVKTENTIQRVSKTDKSFFIFIKNTTLFPLLYYNIKNS